MRIGYDLDGCVHLFVPGLVEFIRLDTGREDLPPTTCYDFYEVDWGYSFEEFLDFCNRGVDAGVVFGYGEPVAGSVEALTRLKQAGHSLHIVTSRHFGTHGSEAVTLDWLNRFELPFDTIHFSSDKTVVETDMFIDDHPDNVKALREKGCEAWMLLDQALLPQGRTDQWGQPYMIESWADFERKVAEKVHTENREAERMLKCL